MGDMLGFDETKLANAEHADVQVPDRPDPPVLPLHQGRACRRPSPRSRPWSPSAKIVGSNGDKIDFGDYTDAKSGKIGTIDVLVGAASGGRGWAWQPVEG